MSHVLIRKAISQQAKYAGMDWWYNFRCLFDFFEEDSIAKFSKSHQSLYSNLTKKWSPELNSEWMCRVYMSAKMVLSATLMINSAQFAKEVNLRFSLSYLNYYSVQSSVRAIVFMCPNILWDEGDIITLTHQKSINVACDVIAKLDNSFSGRLKIFLNHLKAYRELFSYRAPSSGDSYREPMFDFGIVELCQLLCEVAQAQSELLEKSILKNASLDHGFLDKYIDQVCHAQINGYSFFDDEDWYRLGYLARKYPIPTNIMHIMSEGHVEDFFGAWLSKDDDEDTPSLLFNPDNNWGIIFDLP